MKQSMKRTTSKSNMNSKREPSNISNIEQTHRIQKINVVIQDETNLNQIPKVYKNIQVFVQGDGSILGKNVIDLLKSSKLISQQTAISYFVQKRGCYVFGFMMPEQNSYLYNSLTIQPKFIANNTLRIKFRNRKKIIISELVKQQKEKYQQFDEDKSNKGQKQKKISQVVEKVALWRKFYTGFYDHSGNYVQKQLDVAAHEVGIAKKTLDDYLLQIRNGKKYGFNFNQKFNSKIGQLRAFVRDQKKRQTSKQQ